MSNVVSQDTLPVIDYADAPFQPEAFDLRFSNASYITHYSTSGLKNSFLRFSIKAAKPPLTWDLSRAILCATMKITNAKGDAPPAKDTAAAPINCTLNSLFRNVRISLNNVCVSQMNDYALTHYVATRLNADQTDQLTHLKCGNFAPDTPGQYNNTTGANQGFLDRRSVFGKDMPKDKNDASQGTEFHFGSEPVYFCSKFATDFPSLPLNNCDILIECELASDAYLFIKSAESEEVRMMLEECRLLVPQYQISDSVYLRLQEKFMKHPMKTFFTKTHTASFAISKGSRSAILDNVGLGCTPTRMYLTFLDARAYRGDYEHNSFKLDRHFKGPSADGSEDFSIKEIKVYLAGQLLDGITNTNSTSSMLELYYRLFFLSNMVNGERKTCNISPSEFKSDCFISLYDLSANLGLASDDLIPLVRNGALRVEVIMDKPSTIPIIMLAIFEVNSQLILHESGKVQVESY